MIRIPNRTKFRKIRKGKVGRLETKTTNVVFGTHGLQVLESARLSYRQLEAIRRVVSRRIKRMGKIWFRSIPDRPVTTKPAEVRMGKGKGSVSFWACYVKAGRMLIEVDGVPHAVAINALKGAQRKLPCKSRLIVSPSVSSI